MPLGRKVGLDPSDIVLDGDPAPLSPDMSILAKRSPISAIAEHLLALVIVQHMLRFVRLCVLCNDVLWLNT